MADRSRGRRRSPPSSLRRRAARWGSSPRPRARTDRASPRSARHQYSMNSTRSRTRAPGCGRSPSASSGIAWVTMSSRLGLTAEVIATESPSHDSPVVIQITRLDRLGLGLVGNHLCAKRHLHLSSSTDPRQGRRPAGPSPAGRRTPSPPAPFPEAPREPRPARSRLAALDRAQRSQRPVARLRPSTTATITPSLATYIGSMPSCSQAAATSASTGTSLSWTEIEMPDARANSLSAEATPPRVASRMQRNPRQRTRAARRRPAKGAGVDSISASSLVPRPARA